MKPYLTPNLSLAFVIEWGILIISILLVFSPFIYLGIRKWKQHLLVNWKHVIGAYLLSFALYSLHFWVLSKVDSFLYDNHPNSSWLQHAIANVLFHELFMIIPLWSLLIFYCSKLIIKSRFSLLHFIISLALSILLFFSLIVVTLYLMAVTLGSIGRNYF